MSAANEPPRPDQRPSVRRHHGEEFADPWEWLRDKENPEVIRHLEAENSWTESRTAHLQPLVEELFGDVKARTKETDLSVPTPRTHRDGEARRTYWYYARTVEGSEYPIHCRVAAEEMPDTRAAVPGEEILLDQNAEAGDESFFSLGVLAVSPDGRLLAWSSDTSGDERYTLRFRELATGTDLADRITDTGYGLAWAGNDHVFYTRSDEAWRPRWLLRHRIGSDVGADQVVHDEPDDRFWMDVDSSRDQRWIVLTLASKTTSEVRLLPASDPEGAFRTIAPRTPGLEYEVEVAGDRLLITHNRDGVDFALAEAPLTATTTEEWHPVIEHRQGVRLLGCEAYAGHVVISLRRDGLTGLRIIDRDADGALGEGHDLAFDEPIYTVASLGAHDWDAPTIRLSYSSMLTPASVFDLDLATRELTLLKETPVLDHPVHGPYRREEYAEQRIWATAPDGTRVPISVVHRRDTPLDGSAPCLLYGYGSYEIPIDPHFSMFQLSLLDKGFVSAIAHVRGGGELGRSWYVDGKLEHKQHTFDDFIAAAKALVAQSVTSPDRLVAEGGSAGGLLMGAVANQAPECFRAIHAAVPFVDPLTSILDPDLPLTVTEWEEWGDPLHDPEAYAWIKAYAPYENVTAQEYPAILATTSLNDTRVLYVEPAKWVAALRERATNPADRPILLKCEMVAGHGGVSGRYQAWREAAFEYAWLIDQATAFERSR